MRGCLLVGINYRKVHPSKIPVLAHEAYSIRNCLSKTRELLPHGVLPSPFPPLSLSLPPPPFSSLGFRVFGAFVPLPHTRLAFVRNVPPRVGRNFISRHAEQTKRREGEGGKRGKEEGGFLLPFEKACTRLGLFDGFEDWEKNGMVVKGGQAVEV